jgi:asparagine synthase (glutamine-hydrolysing)
MVRRARRFFHYAPRPLAERYLGWVGIFDPEFIRVLLTDRVELDPVHHYQGNFRNGQDRDPIGQLLYVNASTYLPGDLLVKTDRMSMANSLETRCPFLDHELFAWVNQIPTHLKLKGLKTKYILKEALKGFVPEEIIYRKKHGFGVPVGHWFRTTLKNYMEDILLSTETLRRGYFRKDQITRLVQEHTTGKRDHGHRLWTLLTFEMWHRVFMDKSVSP